MANDEEQHDEHVMDWAMISSAGAYELDPEVNLKEQLATAQAIVDDYLSSEEAVQLAELVIALDDWIRKGGPLPRAWAKGRA